MPVIALDWDTMKSSYPMRPLSGPLKAFMDSIPGTPCCVQMSHALIAAGCYPGSNSNRRQNSQITTDLGTNYYMLAVDEMQWFLAQSYGLGDEISLDTDGNRRALQDMKDALNGRTGILVFRDAGFGTHTELWDTDHMHQPDIVDGVFNAPKVLFWDVMITADA